MRSVSLVVLLGLTGCLGIWGIRPPANEPGKSNSSTAFALDVYSQLARREGNLFFSPSCLREALALTLTGARGETASEMASVLHLPADPERARKLLVSERPRVQAFLPGVQLRQVASLWGQRGYGFHRSFLGFLETGYGARVQEVDFHKPDQACKSINSWVEQQTFNHIKNLFSTADLAPTTRLVLASAVYFKGDWAHPFSRESTREETFHLSRKEQARLPLMRQTETFSYTEADGCQLVQIPYAGNEFALLVVLPRDVEGLSALEATLTPDRLAEWSAGLRERKVDVSLPRFKMVESLKVNDILTSLGMKRAFRAGSADFSGMNEGKDPLHLNAVVHKAFLDIHELGTEAAAATGGAIAALSMPAQTEVPPVFRADHPFLFALRDLKTGTILFLGRFVRPEGSLALGKPVGG